MAWGHRSRTSARRKPPRNGAVSRATIPRAAPGCRRRSTMTTGSGKNIVSVGTKMKRISVSGLLVLGLIFSASAQPPQGADPNSEMAKWFKSLRNNQGVPCCDISDCRRVDARIVNGHYEALIDEQWATVPDETIKTVENPIGQHIAYYRYLEASRTFPLCFFIVLSQYQWRSPCR
jgi:hypothetical protein